MMADINSESTSELSSTEPAASEEESYSKVLNRCVSKWTISDVEESLNIYYHNDYLPSPLDVLRKIENLAVEVNEAEKCYIEKVKKYITFNVENFDKLLFNGDRLKANVDQTLEELKAEPERYVIYRVMKFARAFKRLVQDIEDTRIHKTKFEGNYTQFIGAFAELCCLQVYFSLPKSDYAFWNNLKGIPEVTSKPDIRFLKDSIYSDDFDCGGLEVCVVQVRNDHKIKPFRRRRARSFSAYLSSSSSSSGAVRRIQRKDKVRRKRIHLEVRLNGMVLGRHAGELLLDLRRNVIDEDKPTLTMPGMIVDGTKIFFTILEISSSHYNKLKKNTALGDEDRAVIYYSTPLDILLKDDRNVLIDNLMRLNHMK